MEYTELEVLYSPTRWSKRYPHDLVIAKHLQFAKTESSKNKKNIPCELNISYGEREKQKYDIFGTDLPDDSSIFIFIHGGYWQELDRDYSSYVVDSLYKNKLKTIIIGYTLCPKISVQQIIVEIEQAMTSCLEYAKTIGSKGIYISGYSAGSQLIASLFQNFIPSLPINGKKLIKAAILCCGIFDLTPIINTYINEPLKLNFESAKLLSPLYQEIPNFGFTVYIVVGENDSPAFHEQSKIYYEKIKQFGDVKFKIIEEVDHFSIVEKFSCENYELVEFVVAMETKQ